MQIPESLAEIQHLLHRGDLSFRTLVQSYLDQISTTEDYLAFLEVYAEEALQKATELDEKLTQHPSRLGSLAGLVISHKDIVAYKPYGLHAASRILEGYRTPFTATGLERILAEDAIVIGRVNCDEFAMGSSNENSAFGATKNPIHPEYIPGGSSGGSAASVGLRNCLASIGTDTGGSVRQPASFCGVFGFKPSYGAISRYGLVAYGSSFDQMGFISKDPDVLFNLWETAIGSDPKDATSLDKNLFSIPNEPRPQRLAYFDILDKNDGTIDPEVSEAFLKYMELLRSQGHQVDSIPFTMLDYVVPTYYILTTAEASANLSRYDGIRFGHRTQSEDVKNLDTLYKKTRTEGFGLEVKRRLMMGTYVLSAGYYDAYYAKAQKVRKKIVHTFDRIWKDYDFVISPTSPVLPWKIGAEMDPVSVYLADQLTVIANLCGIPAASIPVAHSREGLPIGMQWMAPRMADRNLLTILRTMDSLVIS